FSLAEALAADPGSRGLASSGCYGADYRQPASRRPPVPGVAAAADHSPRPRIYLWRFHTRPGLAAVEQLETLHACRPSGGPGLSCQSQGGTGIPSPALPGRPHVRAPGRSPEPAGIPPQNTRDGLGNSSCTGAEPAVVRRRSLSQTSLLPIAFLGLGPLHPRHFSPAALLRLRSCEASRSGGAAPAQAQCAIHAGAARICRVNSGRRSGCNPGAGGIVEALFSGTFGPGCSSRG